MNTQLNRFLTKKRASELLGISWHTLDKWAKKPGFPTPVKLGARVRYLESEINDWIKNIAETSRAKKWGK